MEAEKFPSSRRTVQDLTHVEAFALGPLLIDPPSLRVSAGERSEMLEPRVMRVLVALGQSRGKVLSRDDLIALCWDGVVVGDNAINQTISRLRHVFDDLAADAVRLETITKVGFRLVVSGQDLTPAHSSNSGFPPAPAGSGIPIVAVLPIAHRGGDEELENLAEILTEEITQGIPRKSRVEVSAAGILAAWRGREIDYLELGDTLGVRYFAEGKLQRRAETIRLTMQIIDARTGDLSWSKLFTRTAVDIGDSPEELSATVAFEIGEHVTQIEVSRAMMKSGPYTGWERLVRTFAYMGRGDNSSETLVEARQAVVALPDFALAHALLALALARPAIMRGIILDDELDNEIRVHVTRALQLGPDVPAVTATLAAVYTALGDGETALRLARRRMDFEPDSPHSYFCLGEASLMLGRTADAIDAFEKQQQLLPHDRNRFGGLAWLGVCYALDGRPEEAEQVLDSALALDPNAHVALKWKAIVAAGLGGEAIALGGTKRLREVEPDMSIDQHVQQMIHCTGVRDRLAEPVATLRRLWHETGSEG